MKWITKPKNAASCTKICQPPPRNAHRVPQDLKQRPKLTVTPEEAASLVASGKFAFVDVRLAKDSEAARIKGAKTAPLYRSIDASNIDPIKAMKYVLFASQGAPPPVYVTI